jgi:hypothetical protein
MGAMPGMMSKMRSRDGMPLAGPGNIGVARTETTTGDGQRKHRGWSRRGRGGAAGGPGGAQGRSVGLIGQRRGLELIVRVQRT